MYVLPVRNISICTILMDGMTGGGLPKNHRDGNKYRGFNDQHLKNYEYDGGSQRERAHSINCVFGQ